MSGAFITLAGALLLLAGEAHAILISGKEVELLPPSRQRASYLPSGSVQLQETPTGYRVRIEAQSLFQAVNVGPVKLQFYSEPKCSGRHFTQAGRPVGPESRPLMLDQASNIVDQVTLEAPGLRENARSVLLTGIVSGKRHGELTARRAVLCGVIPESSRPMKMKTLRDSRVMGSSRPSAKSQRFQKTRASGASGARKPPAKTRRPTSADVNEFLNEADSDSTAELQSGRDPSSVGEATVVVPLEAESPGTFAPRGALEREE